MIFSQYDDSPNYVLVHAEIRRLELKDLTTMASSVTRDPLDRCPSNDENLITRLQPIIWLHWREPLITLHSSAVIFIFVKPCQPSIANTHRIFHQLNKQVVQYSMIMYML